MITELTQAQVVLQTTVRDEWIAIGHSCEPADWDRAEKAMRVLYEAAKLPFPKDVIRLPSPLAGERLAQELCAKNAHSDWGQHDAAWLAFYDYMHQIGVPYTANGVHIFDYMDIAKSCGWWWPFDEALIITDRAEEIHVTFENNRYVLHNLAGPAIRYRDGFAVYCIHGINVPAYIIEQPETITAAAVLAQPNITVRRVMIDQMGAPKFFTEANPTILDKDLDESGLPRQLLQINMQQDEPYTVLSVECPSTGHKSLLRVPPNTRTCIQGFLTSFPGFTDADYAGIVSS